MILQDSLAEVEETYRKAMVSNAQLDNEKSNLMYQVDTLRDTLMELEELLYETRIECEDRAKVSEKRLSKYKSVFVKLKPGILLVLSAWYSIIIKLYDYKWLQNAKRVFP